MDNQTQTPEQILKRIQGSLESKDAKERLSAIQELREQKFSSPAILHTLEALAIKDKSKAVREAARQTLDSPAHRYIQSRATQLKRKDRQTILNEIEQWETQGLIQEDTAEVIRQRYDFDFKPSPSTSRLETPVQTKEQPASDKETPPAPRPSLTQTLLSEISIKIALYLGAFFVIASAAILAAAIEAARIPILLLATIVFAGGAVITRKRLPQPSFALFVVFSFLLPTDANVLADVLKLTGNTNSIYWFFIMGSMALIWGFGTWFYASRLFSLASFIALLISAVRLSEVFGNNNELPLLFLSLVHFFGLAGVYLLQRWKDAKFSLPLFLLTQLGQLALFGFALFVIANRGDTSPWFLATTLFWLLSSVFYILSNLVYPLILFPWSSVAALMPVAVTFMLTFDNMDAFGFAIALFAWGTFHVTASEGTKLFKSEKLQKYHYPLLAFSLLQFLGGIIAGFIENNTWGFIMLTGMAFVYAALQLLQSRWYIWTISLLAGVAAYFTVYALPFMEEVDIFFGYQVLIPSLLLLIPDLLLTPDWNAQKAWRWPLRGIGGFLGFTNVLLLLAIGQDNEIDTAICFGVYAIFFTIFSIRYNRPWIGYIATASLPLSIVYLLQGLEQPDWLLPVFAPATLFFFVGYLLSRNEKLTGWGRMLRFSGLGITGLLSLFAFGVQEPAGGWYALATGLLFGVEMLSSKISWMEAGLQVFAAIGIFMISDEFNIDLLYQLLAVSLTLLILDAYLAKAFSEKRPLRWGSRGLGLLFVVLTTVGAATTSMSERTIAIVCFAIFMLFFLAYALLYKQALIGYGFTLYATLTIVYTLRPIDGFTWLLPVVGLGLIFYGTGFFLRKRNPENQWAFVLWTSGLGIGVLTSILAPVKGSLDAAIAPAIAAMMVTVEAFDHRNVWLGFPANALYLMAYFILLLELNVDEPQFFSIATAALGLLMHYLLTRTGSRTGAFITGMVSQLVLLGTTYIQFVSTEKLAFFAVLFFQALIVLLYGIIIRSRSLVITPIIIVVIAVMTVLFGLLQGIGTIIMIGCTGIILLMLGILAVIMRERIKELGDRFSDWKA